MDFLQSAQPQNHFLPGSVSHQHISGTRSLLSVQRWQSTQHYYTATTTLKNLMLTALQCLQEEDLKMIILGKKIVINKLMTVQMFAKIRLHQHKNYCWKATSVLTRNCKYHRMSWLFEIVTVQLHLHGFVRFHKGMNQKITYIQSGRRPTQNCKVPWNRRVLPDRGK